MQLLNARWPMLGLTLLSVTIYLYSRYDHGWIPHDEGLLGQSATRVIAGQLPHIDFDDPYTGGQAMLHALAMQVFGVNLVSMRWLLLLFSIGFAAVTFLIANRIVAAWCAALVTWIAIGWSVPNYFAALPSWYNLFFAVFGTYAFIKYHENDRRRWLVLAGVMGGLSFLIKVAGLYYIAAGLLFLVYRNQHHDRNEIPLNERSTWYSVFVSVSLFMFVAVLVLLIRSRLTAMDILHFALPGSALALFLVYNQWRNGVGRSSERMRRLVLSGVWFIGGVAAPVLVFLLPYIARSGIGDFIEGVFILPQKRMQFADYPMPPLKSLFAVLPLATLLVFPLVIHRRLNQIWLTATVWTLCIFAILLGSQDPVYQFVWNSARPLVPVIIIVGIVVLLRRENTNPTLESSAPEKPLPDNPILFLLLAMTAMVSLVQFPYSFGIYFCYAIPLGILALVAIIARQEFAPTQLHLAAAVFFLGFTVVWLNHSRIQRMGVRYIAGNEDTRLDLDRGGLLVSSSQAKLYEQVVKSVQRHSGDGAAIYAMVDCPEIYFLANRINPTRSFYEFFEPDFVADPATRLRRIEEVLDQRRVEVVVFHWNGEFSGRVPFEFAQAISTRFPSVEHFVRETELGPESEPTFSVAWRELGP